MSNEELTPEPALEPPPPAPEAHFLVRVDTGIGEQYAHMVLSGTYTKGQRLADDPVRKEIVSGPHPDAESAWALFWAARR